MIDFKIRRGPYSQLFNEDGSIRRDTVALELGCWYLCTDEAWLYLCVEGDDGQLELKQINRNTNATNKPTTGVLPDGSEAERQILNIYTDETTGLLHILFSDDTEEVVVTPNVLDDKLSNIVFPEIDLSEYAKTSDLSGFITIQDVEAKNYLTKEELNEAIESIVHPSVDLSNYATTQYVDDEISKIEFPEVDLTNYFTKEETADAIADAISEQKTVDLTSYATKEWVESKKYLTSIPETYVTKSEMNSIITAAVKEKANEIPFKTAKFVSNPIGSFTVGEDIGGLSIAELFAKLLGLIDDSNASEPISTIDRIITKQIPMYSIKDYTLTKSSYQLFTYDQITKNDSIRTSGFYKVIDDNGNTVEAGYQDVSIVKDDVYYMIALPYFVDYNTMITLQVFDELNNKWVPYDKIPMISDIDEIRSICSEDPQMYIDSVDLNDYTIWMSEKTPTGMLLRFVINE